MALFLDQDKDSLRIDVESVLDFIPIGIVFFFIFVEFYFLSARRLDERSAFLREMRVENLEDFMVAVLAGFRWLTARKPHLRKLYGGLGLYLEEGLSFLQKPFTPRALARKVRETLDRPVAAD